MRLSLAEMQKERSHDSPVYAYSEMYAIFESMGQLDSALYYLNGSNRPPISHISSSIATRGLCACTLNSATMTSL